MWGESGADLIVRERQRGGAYIGAGDLVRRTGLKPRAVESLVMAGAFDSVTPNRRQALWEAGLHPRPSRNGQAVLPVSIHRSVPPLVDFTDAQKMAAEYAMMGIYPRGHLMQFVRPTLDRGVLTCAEVDNLDDGASVLIAGWPVARQHPKGRERHDFRHHRGRDRGHAGYPLGGCVPPLSKGTRQSGSPDCRRNLALGRHFQYHSLRSPRTRLRRADAGSTQLALTTARRKTGN